MPDCTLFVSAGSVVDASALPKLNAAWTPDLLTGIHDWWDCGVGITVDGANGVDAWTSRRGARVAAAVATFAKPVRNRAFNALQAPVFATSLLSIANVGTPAASPLMYWSVLDTLTDVASVSQSIFGCAPFNHYINFPAAGDSQAITGEAVSPTLSGLPSPIGKHVVVLYRNSANRWVVRVDGAEVANVAPSVNLAAISIIDIGMYFSRAANTATVDTALAAFGFASGARGSDIKEVQKLEGYLAQRYLAANFLPVAHPYRTVAPTRLV